MRSTRPLLLLTLGATAASVAFFAACVSSTPPPSGPEDSGLPGEDATIPPGGDAGGTDASDAAVTNHSDSSVLDASDGALPPADAGTDASDGASPPADGGTDANDAASATDAAQDTGTDTGTDAGPADSGGPDATGPADAGADTGPTVLYPNQATPSGIAVDSTNVYWTTYNPASIDGGALYKGPIGGGAATMLASELVWPMPVAVDSTNVYFGDVSVGYVAKVPIDGSSPPVRLAGNSPAINPGSIAVDSSNVYWTNYQNTTVMMVGLDGGTVTTLAGGLNSPESIVVTPTAAYWAELGPVSGNAGNIWKLDLPYDGGAPVAIVTGLDFPRSVATDGTNVYITVGGDNTVRQAPVTGAGPLLTLSTDSTPYGIAVDSTSVYVADDNGSSGAVHVIPIGGDGGVFIAQNLLAPTFLALGGNSVYWLSYGTGSGTTGAVMSAPK
jgi:hypothetical protein